MWNYSEKVKDHFFNPRNARVIADANAIGDVGSISCGDALRLMLKVDPHSEIILEAGFQTFGCGSAIASSSALTELIIGKSLSEASTITNQDIANYLDGLPPEKMHCSVMGREALEAAIANYRGEIWQDDHQEGALICKCFAVDESKIVRAVKENQLTTLEEILNYTKAGGGCGACHEKIEQVLQRTLDDIAIDEPRNSAEPPIWQPLNEAALAQLEAYAAPQDELAQIQEALTEIRPRLQSDGGDVELVAFHSDTAHLRLYGNCSGCLMSEMTLSWVQQQLTSRLKREIRVKLAQSEALTTSLW